MSFIVGAKIPHEPYVVQRWRREHLRQDIGDGHIFTLAGRAEWRPPRAGDLLPG
jgi:hypothetical protein